MPDGSVVKELPVAQPAVTAGKEIISARAAKRTFERIHRKLGDLPETPEKMNAFCAVMMYSLLGLDNVDIAVALRTDVENIERVKELDAYKQLSELFDAATFENARRNANHIIARASDRAAERMVDAIDDADPLIALNASKTVLQFGGVGTEKVDTHKSGGLNIKIVRKGEKRNDEEISVELTNG